MISDHALMAGKPRAMPPRRPKQFKKLFIGEWIRALGMRQVDIVRGTGINEGYLSSLISGSRSNPSFDVLNQVADFLGIPVSYFNRAPPDREFIAEAKELDPRVLARLMNARQ
jgi:transcriptional regulator with XRE-family HTH domain